MYALERVCFVLPTTLQDQCKGFVDIYGKPIIDMLLEETNPKLVCVMLKCCTNNVLLAGKNFGKPVLGTEHPYKIIFLVLHYS